MTSDALRALVALFTGVMACPGVANAQVAPAALPASAASAVPAALALDAPAVQQPMALATDAVATSASAAQPAPVQGGSVAPLELLPAPASPPAASPAPGMAQSPYQAAPAPALTRDEKRRAFAQEMAQRYGWREDWVMAQLSQAKYSARVAQLIMPPAPPPGGGSAKDWDAYRARMVDALRIREGLVFWRAHEAALQRAQARWGVPPAIVVAIVGVETVYGRVTGGFRVIDALSTLAFDFPVGRKDRSAFFRSELEAFLQWCQREQRDPASVLGSYAGAIGLPQFMPSSILKYAVDFDGDGHINLGAQGDDVIGSVANYFAQNGWREGMPTHFEVAPPVDTQDRATLLAPDIKPSFTAQEMRAKGALLGDAAMAHSGPLALVELQRGARAPTHVAGTENFYAITRYNWSAYYAMAVIDLAAELERARSEARGPAARAAQ